MQKHTFCYFHIRWHQKGAQVNELFEKEGVLTLPSLEDANSIQVGLAEVMRQLLAKLIDHRTAALLLYALQTASANVQHTSFEPEPTRVVIDRDSVERRPIGATAWSAAEGREYDDVAEKPVAERDPEEKAAQAEWLKENVSVEWMATVRDRMKADPLYLDKWLDGYGYKPENQTTEEAGPSEDEQKQIDRAGGQ